MFKYYKMVEFEGWNNVYYSTAIEYILTSILLFFIYINVTPGNQYSTSLKITGSNYTYGYVIIGIVIAILLYIATYIALNYNIGAGHMSPLLTVPAMFFPLGVLSVSIIKGLFLLFAQCMAVISIYYFVFTTDINK